MRIFTDKQVTQVLGSLIELERKAENRLDHHCGVYQDIKDTIKEIRGVMVSGEEVKIEARV